MGDPAPTPSRALAMGKTLATFVGAWLLAYVAGNWGKVDTWRIWTSEMIHIVLGGFPAAAELVERFFWILTDTLGAGYFRALLAASILAPLGAATRMIARARLRAGQADFLDAVRSWMAAHPKATRALLWAPAVLELLWEDWPRGHWYLHAAEYFQSQAIGVVPDLLVVWALYAMTKKGVAALLAPTMSVGEATTGFEISADEIVFDAVAVTRRTIATVAAFAATTLAVPAYIATRTIHELFHDRAPSFLSIAYIVFAVAAAVGFRRASRIAVGVDGVHVRGTSGSRFFAYRDIESARVNGGDIELVKRGRVALRLQLHGEDAARRDAVLARIHENLALVKEGRGAIAAQVVATSSKDDLARVAHGAADYRAATLTREQLWALVEGPEVEASARKAAAEALVSSAASGASRDRARLRVAADHCAEPNVRVALAELAGPDEGEAASRSARTARVV